MIRIDQTNDMWIARVSYAQKDIVKRAGFRWNPTLKIWYTRDAHVAAKFKGAPAAKEVIEANKEAYKLSKATEAQDDRIVNPPDGLEYMPFQKVAISFALDHKNVLLSDEMGLGKSIETIGIINSDPSIDTVLIICPNTLKLNWQRELERWLARKFDVRIAYSQDFPNQFNSRHGVLIINYDIVKKFTAQLHSQEWDCLILDECFPAGTLVSTEKGLLPIEKIVARQMAIKVLSFNEKTGCTEYKNIVSYIRKKPTVPLVRVIYEDQEHHRGSFVCTANHPVWTTGGYIEARSLFSGEELRMVRSPIPDTYKGAQHREILQPKVRSISYKSTSVCDKSTSFETHQIRSTQMRVVSPGIHSSRSPREGQTFLFQKMLSSMEEFFTRKQTDVSSECEQSSPRSPWERKSFGLKAHAGQMERPETTGVYVEGDSTDRQKAPRETLCWRARGKRAFDGASDFVTRCVEPLNRGYHSHEPYPVDVGGKGPERVQGGPCCGGCQKSYRNRRPVTPESSCSSQRRKEGSSLTQAWVVRVEAVEQGHQVSSSRSNSESEDVYCIDVADNSNFFANGVLVHNCHYVKSERSQRTRAILGRGKSELPIKAKRKLFLTGTPIPNRPIEGWTTFHALDPKTFPKWWDYVTRYCNAHHNGFGLDTSGAAHLDELQVKLRSSIMVRRKKEDVLKELPDKRRAVVEIPPEGASHVVSSEARAMASSAAHLADLKAAVELAKAEGKEAYENAVHKLSDGIRAAFDQLAKLRHDTAVAKVPFVISFLEDMLEEQEKVVLFAWHHDVINPIVEHFGKKAARLTGENKLTDRQEAVDRFQNDPSCRLFVGSITAAGVGLTLTAASHVVFAELDWVPGNMTQAEDRLHRIGQKDSVLVQHLVFDGSIDAKMAKKLVAKQKIIDQALDADVQMDSKGNPVLPIDEDVATDLLTRKEVTKASVKLTAEQVSLVHESLQGLTLLDGDHASRANGVGFSKIDSRIGHSLANEKRLTAAQAVLGWHLCKKYRKQLPKDVREDLGLEANNV